MDNQGGPMKLNLENLESLKKVLDDGPKYDVEALRKNTSKNPKWLAFGTGNIFRGYIARIAQEMANSASWNSGIIAVESFSDENIKNSLTPHDNLTISVTLHKDGSSHTELIANLAESFLISAEYERMQEIFRDPNLQLASYTITEKGYGIKDSNGQFSEMVKAEMEGPEKEAKNLMVQTAFLMYERYKAGAYPLTLLSIDNCSENGTVLRNAVLAVADEMVKNGRFDEGFLSYLEDEKQVSFPWTMIDKITPSPSKMVADKLVIDLGIEDAGLIDRGVNRPAHAPFVNSEEAEYLVIEDKFVNGRPPFEKSKAMLTNRETVKKIETMKVTTCLNPLHTAMSIYGCIFQIPSIAEVMKDNEIVSLIKNICYKEALPVVVDPGIINPKEFADEVINTRLPNPYIPDQPSRIAMDTSQKVAIRFGHTIKTYMENDNLDSSELKYIPLALAGWLRYLLGVTDDGEEFNISSDPLLDQLKNKLKGIELGKFEKTEGLKNLLHDTSIFGVDLYQAGLAEKIIGYFEELCSQKGAVRATLKKYL